MAAAIKPQAYTVAEAAKELDTTPTSIHRWLSEGKLERWQGVVAGQITLITAKSITALKANGGGA